MIRRSGKEQFVFLSAVKREFGHIMRFETRFLDERGMRLVGHAGNTLALGDTITVQVVGVSVPRRKIDLRLAGALPATASTSDGRLLGGRKARGHQRHDRSPDAGKSGRRHKGNKGRQSSRGPGGGKSATGRPGRKQRSAQATKGSRPSGRPSKKRRAGKKRG